MCTLLKMHVVVGFYLWSPAGIESEHNNRDFLETDPRLLSLLFGLGLVVAEVGDFRLFLFLSLGKKH